MPATLTVRDETPAGGVSREWSLEFLEETITVRDLIRERVYQEVRDHNARSRSAAPYRGLVQPEAYERTLNGPADAKARPIDWSWSRAIPGPGLFPAKPGPMSPSPI